MQLRAGCTRNLLIDHVSVHLVRNHDRIVPRIAASRDQTCLRQGCQRRGQGLCPGVENFGQKGLTSGSVQDGKT